MQHLSVAMYGIQQTRTGWEVRVVRQSQRHCRNFSNRRFGSPAAALQAAQQWRDKVVQEYLPTERRVRAQVRRSNGSGPITGVTPDVDRDGKVVRWRAKTYVGPGVTLQKTFSTLRYGDAAKVFAIAERQRHLQEVRGLSQVHPAEAQIREAPPFSGTMPEELPLGILPKGAREIPGVILRRRLSKAYWCAQTTIGGTWRSKCFSIKEYGEAQAFAFAVQERERQVRAAVAQKEALALSTAPGPRSGSRGSRAPGRPAAGSPAGRGAMGR